jgi:2-C-methyl-D-erythritol 4-phosphate cytidylyltransferase
VRVAAIVVAAGTGERFGDRKQFCDVAGQTAAARAVAASRSVAELVVLVAPPDELADAHGADVVVAGGATRSASVRAGLAAVPEAHEVVVVHDAARPLASPALFRAVIDALATTLRPDGAIPGLGVTDTLKQVAAGPDRLVAATLDRAMVVVVQTPQAFRAEALRRAHERGADATDDAALVESIGGRVVVVDGEPGNRKLTTRDDLAAIVAALVPR